MERFDKMQTSENTKTTIVSTILLLIFFLAMGSFLDTQSSHAMFENEPILEGDLNNDNTVDIKDVMILSESWLDENSAADICPTPGDGIVNYLDFSKMQSNWLVTLDV